MDLSLFLSSIKSEETKEHYQYYLQKYFDFAGGSTSTLENKTIENKIIKFVLQLKEQGKTYSAIQNYLAPIKLYYNINDVVLNIRKIDRFLPEQKRVRKDRPYEHEEIKKILDISDERIKCVILLLSSSGIRVGALPTLRLKHLQGNRLTVYEGFREEYITFITPECSKAIDNYIDMRSRYGEKIDDDSLLIREQFDLRNPQKPKPVNKHLIQYKLYDLSKRSGINRSEVKNAHGYRKFFTRQLIESNVKIEYRWLLEGHKLKGNDSSYVRVTDERLEQEYSKAIDSLTIDPTQRLQKQVETLKVEKSIIDSIASRLNDLEKLMK